MHTEYRWVLADAERNDDVRVIVVTGAGQAFCAGADTAALDGHAERGAYDAGVDVAALATPGFGVRPEFDHSFAFHYGIPKPVIAAINGPAAGVGLVLACYCDIRYAASGAKLTTSNGRLGLPAEYGLSWVLPRLVGIGRAADLLFSSRVVLAEEAERIGLVNGTMPADELMPTTLEYARAMAADISPSSLRESKRQLYTDLHGDVGSAVAESERLLERMATEPDFREGVAAWREKRPPRF
jgi:enoyl-CoA hydratase/carnithine racemase